MPCSQHGTQAPCFSPPNTPLFFFLSSGQPVPPSSPHLGASLERTMLAIQKSHEKPSSPSRPVRTAHDLAAMGSPCLPVSRRCHEDAPAPITLFANQDTDSVFNLLQCRGWEERRRGSGRAGVSCPHPTRHGGERGGHPPGPPAPAV